jgi:colicin import membrane protein
MWQVIRQHPLAALAAIVAHVALIAVLVFSFQFGTETPAGSKGEKIEAIEVVAVDEKAIEAELQRIRQAERRKQEAARRAREARLKEERRLAELKKQRAAEERRRKEEARKRKAQQAAEKKRLAELEKQRKEAERKEQERQRREQEEQQRRAEQERREAELQAQMAAESQAREAQARRAANQTEINKYRSLIKSQVTRHWIIPATSRRDLVCEVKVRLIPSGDVVAVQIVKSSGDPAFDKSVEKAVYRAAPLPVPPADSGLFDEFREVIFTFEPRNRQ